MKTLPSLQSTRTTYEDKNKLHFKVPICENLGVSHLAGKKVNIENNNVLAIQEHLVCCLLSIL